MKSYQLLLVDDGGRVLNCNKGCVWRETDAESTDLETVIFNLLDASTATRDE